MNKNKERTEWKEKINPLTINGAKITNKYKLKIFINAVMAVIICIGVVLLSKGYFYSNHSKETIKVQPIEDIEKTEKQIKYLPIWKNGQEPLWFEPIVQTEKESKETETETEQKPDQKVQVADKKEEEQKQEVTAYTIKNVEGICQLPELPTGCEVTALATLLNYKGIKVDKCELAMKYMPRMDFYYAGGKLNGPDPMYTFAGNPFDNSGIGCFAPCLCATTRKYFKEKEELKSKYKTVNLSNKELSYILKEYVAKDSPVVVIASQNLEEAKDGPTWEVYHGASVKWKSNHHAMLIYGFDISRNEIYVCDPLRSNGKYTYNLKKFEEIYNSRGKSAMTIVDR